MRDYGPRMRTAVHAQQQVHDRIAQALKASSRVRLDFTDIESVGETFLDRSLGALVAWDGATVFRSLVFAHCSPSVAASIGKAFPQAGPIRGASRKKHPQLERPFRVADDPAPSDEHDRDADGRERGKVRGEVSDWAAFDDFSERQKSAHRHEVPPDTPLPAARRLKGVGRGHRVLRRGRPALRCRLGRFSKLGSELI